MSYWTYCRPGLLLGKDKIYIMEIKNVVLPIVTDQFESTVAFYKTITGKEVYLSAAHDGYKLCGIDKFVVLGAVAGPEALEIPRMVQAIFIVDEVKGYWELLKDNCRKVIVPYSTVSTGTRFIIEQQDGKIIEYLQLND